MNAQNYLGAGFTNPILGNGSAQGADNGLGLGGGN